MSSHNYVFIMAGGVGSRFWPKSRNAYPKQFIDILGIGKSLLQLTYERFLKLCPSENIFVVTNAEYRHLIIAQLPGIIPDNILCEPSRNNTAPCIAYSAFRLFAHDPQACMVVAPSDHFIMYEDVFIRNIEASLKIVSEKNILLTLGISPTRPDTGYGYIRFDKQSQADIYKVAQFTEKPVYAKAVEFVNEGNYLWNAGIFIWNVQTVLDAFEYVAPEIYDLFNKGRSCYNTKDEQSFIDANYPQSPNTSIDYAIMEKADNVYTMPVDFGWSDLGTWSSLYEVAEKNSSNNVIAGGESILEDTADCIIHIPKDKLAVIRGLENFIVVDDDNVLLIYPKSHEQEVKKITEQLKTAGKNTYL